MAELINLAVKKEEGKRGREGGREGGRKKGRREERREERVFKEGRNEGRGNKERKTLRNRGLFLILVKTSRWSIDFC